MNLIIIFVCAILLVSLLLVGIKTLKHSIKKKKNQEIRKFKPVKFIQFNDLDFKALHCQIIFIDSKQNQDIDRYIRDNYDEFIRISQRRGFDFFYFPIKCEVINSEEYLSYNFPNINSDKVDVQTIVNYNQERFLSKVINETGDFCGFFRYWPESQFSYIEIDETDLLAQYKDYINGIHDQTSYYSLGTPDDENDTADFNFGIEAERLLEEIKLKISKLKMIGVGEPLLKSLIFEKPQISRLTVTKDFRIILPDYNDLEIKLHPLPKAVYLLFLNHPEGILFKQLADYKGELQLIYNRITNYSDIDKIEDSINAVTDPSKNAINEKCSRIKEAFLEKIKYDLAVNYIISGNRGEPKLISLKRDLIVFEFIL